MSTFETQHPRQHNGKFATKNLSESEAALSPEIYSPNADVETQIAQARNPEATAKDLTFMARKLQSPALPYIAAHQDVTGAVLDNLARRDNDKHLHEIIVSQRAVMHYTLRYIAEQGDPSLHRLIARRTVAPVYTLDQLAKNGDEDTKIGVAGNSSTSNFTLRRLAVDDSKKVRETVYHNPHTSEGSKELIESQRKPRFSGAPPEDH